MESWIGCSKIYDSRLDLYTGSSKLVQTLFEEFTRRINKKPKYNVWYDSVSPRIFGADETYDNSPVPNEASFLASAEEFLFHPKWGLASSNALVHSRSGFSNSQLGLIKGPDAFYEDLPDLHKFKDSTILILGGGPSVNHVDWSDLKYDYVWSCNDFYKNPKILKENLALTYLNSETHMAIPQFSNHIRKNNTICIADTSITRSYELLSSFNSDNIKTVSFNQRVFLSSGAMPKLVFFASVLGAKKVLFAGMDGWTKKEIETMTTEDHAFDPGKKLKISKNYTFDFQRRETVVYWDYMLNFFPNAPKFQNLGEEYENCMSSEISKKAFPLLRRSNK